MSTSSKSSKTRLTLADLGLVTVQKAAELLDVSETRVKQFIEEERLPAARIGPESRGGQWLLRQKDVEAFKKLPRQGGNPNFIEKGKKQNGNGKKKRA